MGLKTGTGQPGLVIEARRPSIVANVSNVTYVPEGRLRADLTGAWSRLGFTGSADGGYWSLSIQWEADQDEAEDWLEDGLSTHIAVYNEGGVLVWEGFVNMVNINVGDLQARAGPLSGVANRYSVKYSLVTEVAGDSFTLGGLRTLIGPAYPAVSVPHLKARRSQLKHGIFEKIGSVNGAVYTASTADNARDTQLSELSFPDVDQRLSTSRSAPPGISLECLGYIHFLNNWIYTDYTATGSSAITNAGGTGKMQAVIGTDPNGLFSVANSDLQNVALLVPDREEREAPALKVIQGMVEMGDGTDARTVFGVWGGRKIVYQSIPTAHIYEHMLADPEQKVTDLEGRRVLPWNVLPGEWMLFSDFLVGRTVETDLSEDPRALFVQDITYTAPWSLSITGSRVGTARQMLARLAGGTL